MICCNVNSLKSACHFISFFRVSYLTMLFWRRHSIQYSGIILLRGRSTSWLAATVNMQWISRWKSETIVDTYPRYWFPYDLFQKCRRNNRRKMENFPIKGPPALSLERCNLANRVPFRRAKRRKLDSPPPRKFNIDIITSSSTNLGLSFVPSRRPITTTLQYA